VEQIHAEHFGFAEIEKEEAGISPASFLLVLA
jgi:hypothetical protein